MGVYELVLQVKFGRTKNNWSESQLKAEIINLSGSKNNSAQSDCKYLAIALSAEKTITDYSLKQKKELIELLEKKINLLKNIGVAHCTN